MGILHMIDIPNMGWRCNHAVLVFRSYIFVPLPNVFVVLRPLCMKHSFLISEDC